MSGKLNFTEFNRKLNEISDDQGIKNYICVLEHILSIDDKENKDKKKQVNGELCEQLLLALTKYYLKHNHITGEIFHSLYLPNRLWANPPVTEVDFTLVTPYFCLSGECKSYYGEKVITGEGTIQRGSNNTDVAKQHKRTHGLILSDWLSDYFTPKKNITEAPYGLFLFLYSKGKVKDTRDHDSRYSMPMITSNRLYAYYDKIFSKYTTKVYNYNALVQKFKYFESSQKLKQQHRRALGY